jgi:TRAP-type C4-dicarboxylate transport system permease small subunit
MKQTFNNFVSIVASIARWLNWIAGVSLMLMVVLVVADICGIKLFKTPVPGGIEIVSLLSVVAISFAIAQTQIAHGHIEVEMLVTRLPKMAQKVISSFVHCFGILLFVILGLKSFSYGQALQSSGEVSMTLQIPFYPFVWGMGFCCLVVALVLVTQMIKMLRET